MVFLKALNQTRVMKEISTSLHKVNYQIYAKVLCVTYDRKCDETIITRTCDNVGSKHGDDQLNYQFDNQLDNVVKRNVSVERNVLVEQYLIDWFNDTEVVVSMLYVASLTMMLFASILILFTCRNKRNYIHMNLFVAFALRGGVELISWFTNHDLAVTPNKHCGSRIAIHYFMILTRILAQSWLTIETWVITRILRQFNPWHTMSLRRVVFVGYICPFIIVSVYGLVRYVGEADYCWTAPPKWSFWFWYIPAQFYSWLTTTAFFQVFFRLVFYKFIVYNCEEGARPMTRNMNQNVFEIMCASSWVGFHQMLSDLGPPLKHKSFKPWLAKIYIDRTFEGLQGSCVKFVVE